MIDDMFERDKYFQIPVKMQFQHKTDIKQQRAH